MGSVSSPWEIPLATAFQGGAALAYRQGEEAAMMATSGMAVQKEKAKEENKEEEAAPAHVSMQEQKRRLLCPSWLISASVELLQGCVESLQHPPWW